MRNLNVSLRLAITGTAFLSFALSAWGAEPSKGVFHLGARGGSVEYPPGWYPHHYANLHELWNAAPERLAGLQPDEREAVPRIETNVIPCADHAEAVRRLREIEAEWPQTSRFRVIGGWPALERRQLIPKPRSNLSPVDSGFERLYMVTTAVAAGDTLVRLDGFAPETASPQVFDRMESIGRSLRPGAAGDPDAAAQEVDELRADPSLPMSSAPSPEESSARPLETSDAVTSNAVTSVAAINLDALDAGVSNVLGGSETEIAVSPNGTNIVVAKGCNYANSTDGGASFPNSGSSPGNCTGGDSSLAFGKSGNFYWSNIGTNKALCSPPCKNDIQEMAVSTTNGATFFKAATVIDCLVTPGCGFGGGTIPDQEHIAADAFNSGAGGDQVYLVFRKGPGYGILCSQNSGVTWTPVQWRTGGSIDFPRIAVAQTGTVYVVYNIGNAIGLDSYSSCAAGLVLGRTAVQVGSGNPVVCPIPGLDRCNAGNTLRSPMVAVDNSPNSNHLYAAYGVNTVPPFPVPPGPPPEPLTTLGNEIVLVQDSIDGGSSWRPGVQVSRAVNGRRYEMWVCATEGTAVITWQDRRAATLISNDLTDYFASTAFLNTLGNLTPGADFKIDGATDPQCASGWPGSTRSANDSESCSTQPQLAGRCGHSPPQPTDSLTPCDFSGSDATVCSGTETCQVGRGSPKYGDYTGNACVLGRLLAAWPSATNQPGAPSTGGKIRSFFTEAVVAPTPTTTTYTGPNSAPVNFNVLLSATLVLGGTSLPVAGQTVTFTLGAQSCTGTTDSTGTASCALTLTQPAASYTVKAAFGGAGNYKASSDSKTFNIT